MKNVIHTIKQVYSGMKKDGYVQPWTLAKQDIVITTYETLKREIYFVDLPTDNGRCCWMEAYMRGIAYIPCIYKVIHARVITAAIIHRGVDN